MMNMKLWFFASFVTLIAPQIANAACYETKYTPASTVCSSRDTSGSADFQGTCHTTPAKTEQVEIECPGKWVQAAAAQASRTGIVTQAATCSAAGLRPSTLNGFFCASGERRPTQGGDAASINYIYGKKGDGNGDWGGSKIKTEDVRICVDFMGHGECREYLKGASTYCYTKGGGKQNDTRQDVLVAYYCE